MLLRTSEEFTVSLTTYCAMAPRKRLGELLVDASLLTEDQLSAALKIQENSGQRLGQILVDKGWVSEEQVFRMLSKKLHIQYTSLDNVLISQEVIRLIPKETAVKHHMLPVLVQNRLLYVVMENPQELNVIQQIEFATGMQVKPLLTAPSQLRKAIHTHYSMNEYVGQVLEQVEEPESLRIEAEAGAGKDTKSTNEIVKLSGLIISEGIKLRASDIHIELSAHHTVVSYRIDGMLTPGIKLPHEIFTPLLTRMKALAKLDLAEHRTAQDGHMRVKYGGRAVDLRVSILITESGEKTVIRVLDKRSRFDEMTGLGMSSDQVAKYRNVLREQGLILAVGPSGSGKTTTLYTLLNHLRDGTRHIVTIEDPIEYQLPGITQIHMNPRVGATFASGLRSVLRQNPNVILIGEIRDADTASVVIQAVETGHLVLSTLHANSAVSSVARLQSLGISPDRIASNVLVVIGQRLIRMICPRCRASYPPTPEEYQALKLQQGDEDVHLFHGQGCKTCRHTGYYGQIGIFELFVPNRAIREAIARGAGQFELQRLAGEAGMSTMCHSGLDKVRQEMTTLEEVMRVCPFAEDLTEQAPQAEVPAPNVAPAQDRAEQAASERPETDDVASESEDEPEFKTLVLRDEIIEGIPRILVAEDDHTVQNLLKKLLQSKGYQVLPALDGEEALAKIQSLRPDLVILDINMPKRDGFSVCEALRANVATAFIPVIMLTALSSLESKVQGLAVGADDYMTKPFHPQELLARIEAILRRAT
jgi:type IV pilus assembly protein PilB